MWKSRFCRLIALQVVGTFGLLTYLHLATTSSERDRETLQKTQKEYDNVDFGNKLSPAEKTAALGAHQYLVNTSSTKREPETLKKTNNTYGDVRLGGKWSPTGNRNGSSGEKMAILVTFRDREEHLSIFLSRMHPFFQRQGLDYTIYVIEQHGEEPRFCKGLLYNVGFTEALKDDPSYDCFVLHDVDLIPENDSTPLYTCAESPYHLSVAVDKLKYKLPYPGLVGGVLALSTSHYKLLNGYSNLYCGWGAEDDDLARRMYKNVLRVKRPDKAVARYHMLPHGHKNHTINQEKYFLLFNGVRRAKMDGLLDLHTKNYTVTSITRKALYTHVLVNVTKRNAINTHMKV
ncbi:PREDICTED: beta-1,4-galactosyltransferase 2-like [Branchiostoma belcheri]|uniref:Beta-1,4-galactosyltransferase n=1 Tax=Branchiostoma belcheri TaxID=7741 RepID=A0A6P4ZHV7_BRABE|nr:PREDICTED: beta-1,4-galactosyltransferase 2-like [Branchiostoma belcheri]